MSRASPYVSLNRLSAGSEIGVTIMSVNLIGNWLKTVTVSETGMGQHHRGISQFVHQLVAELRVPSSGCIHAIVLGNKVL